METYWINWKIYLLRNYIVREYYDIQKQIQI
nr:MAG TPA: hypothetical protein [Caudoviricetes sp.]